MSQIKLKCSLAWPAMRPWDNYLNLSFFGFFKTEVRKPNSRNCCEGFLKNEA